MKHTPAREIDTRRGRLAASHPTILPISLRISSEKRQIASLSSPRGRSKATDVIPKVDLNCKVGYICFQMRVAPRGFKREDGENPSRTRRCNRVRKPQGSHCPEGWEGAASRMTRKPEDLPATDRDLKAPVEWGWRPEVCKERMENGIPEPLRLGSGILFCQKEVVAGKSA